MFSPNNPTQTTSEVITDLTTGNDVHATVYNEYGQAKNPMWLCLDKKGNIIKRAGTPVLKSAFQAEQKSLWENVYNERGFLDKKVTKIYACKNCAATTGIRNCKFVW